MSLFALVAVIIRSANRCKAYFPSNYHIIRTTGTMDDEDIPAAVEAADDPHMTVTWVKDQITRLGVAPADRRAVAVLGSCSAAVTDDVLSAALVVEYPIDETGAV